MGYRHLPSPDFHRLDCQHYGLHEHEHEDEPFGWLRPTGEALLGDVKRNNGRGRPFYIVGRHGGRPSHEKRI
jgi:hypothetical protein